MRYLQAAYSAPATLDAVAAFRPDFILLDLGVSSRQLDEAERGFTFRPSAPLDMRMGSTGPTAADVPQHRPTRPSWHASSTSTATSGRPAGWRGRSSGAAGTGPFVISDDLVNAIRATLGPRAGPSEFARLFQAVRIAVNDELAGLASALPAFRDALTPGGRLAVITYHSGEDRLVKQAFREWAAACICPPRQPVCTCRGRPLGRLVPRKPIVPGPRRSGGEPPRAERAPPDLPGGRCDLRGGTG